MSSSTSDSSARSLQFSQVLARYLVACEQGQKINVNELLAEYPDFANSLRAFLATHEDLQRRVSGEVGKPGQDDSGNRTSRFEGKPPSHTTTDLTHSKLGSTPAALTETSLKLMPGTRFGDYELLEEIARGGMGVIFRARHLPLNRTVALKLILSGSMASAEDVARFQSEAEIVASLDHPAIVHVYEVGQIRGIHFFSMAYLSGGTLSDRVRGGPLEPRKAAEYVRRIAEAIAYAHERGVVHRDLKPSNVLLDAQGEPKVTDFGLAKRQSTQLGLTLTGQILGTPAYMAPEQAAGQHENFSPQLDVYALGAILYHLLTGKAPFRANNPIDIMLQVLDRDPDPVSQHNRQVPIVLQRICQRAMEKHVARRYHSAAELARDLEAFLKDEPIRWPQESWLHGMRCWWRREPMLLAHWYGIAVTLMISWSHWLIRHTEFTYVGKHSLTLLFWAGISWLLQKWMNRRPWRDTACVAWGATDVLLFTYVLQGVSPPRDSLLVGYAMLIVCSGLFLRVRYVTMMTISSLVGFGTLVAIEPEEFLRKPHHMAIFAACLSVIGMVVGALVRRVRALREYYEEK